MQSRFDKKPLYRLGMLVLLAGVLAVWVCLDLPCLVRWTLRIPCLTCGMSRAWLAALQLDWKAAFMYHPMFWSIPVLALLWLFIDRIPRRWAAGAATVVMLGFLVCYVIRLMAQ